VSGARRLCRHCAAPEARHRGHGSWTCDGCHRPQRKMPPRHSRAESAAVRRRDDALFEKLRALARDGAECPDLDGLARILECTRKQAGHALRRLSEDGRISCGRGRWRIVSIPSDGTQTRAPRATVAPPPRGRPGDAPTSGFRLPPVRMAAAIPDRALYGARVDDVLALRRAGWVVVRSETLGHPPGRYCLDGQVVAPDEVARRAARLREIGRMR
jgi:hypothetical protein